ncbi:sugar-transfer associated ATP-grasp domain-containing protein [Microbacterium sp. F2]|uniref:sugar-transfer associated ATP-grasp domain-containing protein n=1 Tax=Microbacterium sp. F2 TaxID=3422228 RepID=UPI003FD513FB
MASRGLGSRFGYMVARLKVIDLPSVIERAREVSEQFHKWTPAVVVDMFWQATFHQVGFQDYVDYDFAILNRRERRTMMTHPHSNKYSYTFDDPEYRGIFYDKWEFDRVFSEYLGRDWMMVTDDNVDELRAFGEAHPVLITKKQAGRSGAAINRYYSTEIEDWADFHAQLRERGELLIEENIVQHPDVAAVCAGTVNSTRVAAFFDGEKTHILAIAQKFGRGQVADQMDFGGFYTMLDPETGASLGDGYDSHGHVHKLHPDSGYPIADFQLPMFDEVIAFVDKVARHVPQVKYVGWDIAVTPDGPVLIEGNWATGVYENKPSVLGIRTGHRPRYQKAMGF